MKKPVSLVLMLLFGAIVAFPQESEININKEEVVIEKIKKDLYRNYIAVTGTVEPVQTMYLVSLENDAVVEEILLAAGSTIRKGDIIVKLSNQELLLQISEYEAQLEKLFNELKKGRLLLEQQSLSSRNRILELQSQILQQEKVFRKNEELYNERLISQEEYEYSKKQYDLLLEQLVLHKKMMRNDSLIQLIQLESFEKSIIRMKDNIERLHKRVESLHYRSPVSGELTNLDLEIGQILEKGQKFGQVTIPDSYKLRVDIDEYFISDVLNGLSGECNFSGKRYNVIISKIYPEVSAGRFTVDMEFSDEVPEKIRVGQTCRIRLELGNPRDAILLPRGGYYASTGGHWVYVVDPDGKFAEKREIRLGSQNPRYYEVLEGLKPGDMVIISDYEAFGNADKLIFK